MSDIVDDANDFIDAVMENKLKRRVKYTGVSLEECEECGESIPEQRREAIPGVRLCVDCQESIEAKGSRYAKSADWKNNV